MKAIPSILIFLVILSCNSERNLKQQIKSIHIQDKTQKYDLGIAGIKYISLYNKDIRYSKSLVKKMLESEFFPEAIYAVELLQVKYPQDSELFYLRGLGYRKMHQYPKSLENIKYAIRMQPANKKYLNEERTVLEEKGIWNEIQAVNESLINSIDSFNLLLIRAEKLFSIREYDAVLYDLGSVSKMGSVQDSLFFIRQVSSLNQEKGKKSVEILSDLMKYYRSISLKHSIGKIFTVE